MQDRYLHEGETLLCSRRSSPAVLILVLLWALFETVVAGAILSILLAAGLYFGLGTTIEWWMVSGVFVICLGVAVFQHVHIWREATFRVTTERILLANPVAFFHAPLATVKWPQYQECEVDHRHFLDIFFLARPIRIRYGTADARSEGKFPSLRYAEDIKHYLDKVDAAVRKGETATLKPFIARPRGQRDVLES
ncbi:hypothetical protein EXS70_04530 [Candidatus Peribacteria bacterium]|nr:hypothetical protein [Candidatus Peribacteria bacterium]